MTGVRLGWSGDGGAVHTDERRRGHGTALIRPAARAAAEEGRAALAVAVADDNPAAARLYLRLGFRETGLRAADVRHLVLDIG